MDKLLQLDLYKNLKTPEVLWRSSDFLAIWKPHGMHSDQGKSQDRTLHQWVKDRYSDMKGIAAYHSEDLGLLYRLDYETAGVVLYGCNEHSINHYKDAQQDGSLCKHYVAVTKRKPVFSENRTITSYFRSFGPKGREVRAVFNPDTTQKQLTKELYSTKCLFTEYQDGLYYNHVTITRGFRHQIRAHLASLKSPIVGDPLYGSVENGGDIGVLELYCLGVQWSEYDLEPLSIR